MLHKPQVNQIRANKFGEPESSLVCLYESKLSIHETSRTQAKLIPSSASQS